MRGFDKALFFTIHVLLLFLSILAIATWRAEMPDGTIFIDPTGFFLLPIALLSLLRISLGRFLLVLSSGIQVLTSISGITGGQFTAGILSIGLHGFLIYFLTSTRRWKSFYTPLGVFRCENANALIGDFRRQILFHEDQLFGVSLYLEGVRRMYVDQPGLLEMNEQSFSSITNRAEAAISSARSLLRDVESSRTLVHKLRAFKFPPTSGHPMLDEMTQRAQILVKTFDRLFPDHPRTEPLSETQLTKLLEESAAQI